jgi:hypothetical protein
MVERSAHLTSQSKPAERRFITPLYMKTHFAGWLRGTLLAALLTYAAQAARAHGHGGSMGSHFSGSHGFAFHHDHDHFFHHDRDHDHDRFFRNRFFFGFGYPYWYPYYPYDYGYYYDYYGASYSDQYWTDVTAAVQTELARDGYYHGQIDGVVSSDTVRAIRAYRKAKGLPVTSQIDRRLLKSLDI